MEEKSESEVSPQLPTSGQIMGVLVKSLGLDDHRLRSKTAQRYFSGRLDAIVKESSRKEIIEATSDALATLGFQTNLKTEEETSHSALAAILDWHAVHWDRMRTFLLPRMSRVYPSHLADVWQTYLKLATIDLAFRVAANFHLSDQPLTALDFLNWSSVDHRGSYLNDKRKSANVSLVSFAESVGVNDNTVEAWLYRGARPSNENISKIATAFASDGESGKFEGVLRDLEMLYWVSEIAGILGKHIGSDAVDEIIRHLHKYVTQIYRMINESKVESDTGCLEELVTGGSRTPLAQPLLAELMREESDTEWTEDLSAAGSDWLLRVLKVNFQVHRSEVDELIEKTEGRILKLWDISNPQAYEHYLRSMELQLEGRLEEAVSEVAKAVELDPLDPANHCTLGSAKGGIGINTNDDVLINEGLEALWIAVALDPDWILPWTEIGWLLLGSGRAIEAVEHLRSVRPECSPLDSGYYNALGMAYGQLGELAESLAAFESSLKLNPNDPRIAADAAVTALLVGDTLKSNKYCKLARHLGLSDELDRYLELVKVTNTDLPFLDIAMARDQELAGLGIAIARRPDDAMAYLNRARVYFLKREDSRAISDLNTVLRIDPNNVAALVLRGIIRGYLGKHDLTIADMSEAIRLAPYNAMAHYYRGLAYGELDSLDLAITDLSEAVRLSPGHVDAYRARGDSYLYRGEYDLAIADYDTAIQLDVDHAPSHRGRGSAYRMKGEFELAIDDYNIALRLTPEDPFALRFRGDTYLAKGDYHQAISDFDAALKIDCSDEVAYRKRGIARLSIGQFDLAISDFDLAIERNPMSPQAYYGRGLTHKIMGDSEKAENDFRQARELGYDESV